MPICRKCSGTFPNKIKIDGKIRNLQRRKYCLSCSPFGKHNTKKIGNPTKGDMCSCVKCGKNYVYVRNGDTLSKCTACGQRGRHRKFKIWAVEYKGRKCFCCGYSKCMRSLDFHHLDPNTKEFEITNMYNRSKENAMKELDKCVLLCKNCHGEVHEGILELKIPCVIKI
jgi:hypothetical protein